MSLCESCTEKKKQKKQKRVTDGAAPAGGDTARTHTDTCPKVSGRHKHYSQIYSMRINLRLVLENRKQDLTSFSFIIWFVDEYTSKTFNCLDTRLHIAGILITLISSCKLYQYWKYVDVDLFFLLLSVKQDKQQVIKQEQT